MLLTSQWQGSSLGILMLCAMLTYDDTPQKEFISNLETCLECLAWLLSSENSGVDIILYHLLNSDKKMYSM